MSLSSMRPLSASYRFQLTPEFGFDAAVELLPSVQRLGISHVYLSPITEAVPGSAHGYDVVDHRIVRAEFGGEAGLRRLLDAADVFELGVIVDHVPNHVSVARPELNPSWWALLRDGPESPAAKWFDVDWKLTDGKVIVPKLGEPLDDVLDAGEIQTTTGEHGPELRVGTMRFPLASGTEHFDVPEALAAQHYVLTWWRNPVRNVRRFFTIDDLVAVQVEHDEVVAVVDTLPRLLCDHRSFAGLRVDHVDGLADPQRYLDGLRNTIGDRWLLVEKILGPGERLPTSWPVDGTTGYEHVTAAEHLLLDRSGLGPLDDLWRDVASVDGALPSWEFEAIERAARIETLEGGLEPDLDRLVRRLVDDVGIEPAVARSAIVALTIELERYRTYLPDDEPSRRALQEAEQAAADRQPEIATSIGVVADAIRRQAHVRTRWQQLTGPVMAKGAEDRAFYRHHRLSSLCEVGGRPGSWTLDADAFHSYQSAVQAGWPTTMLTATTHDTKRSEAVRARSLALATMADEWVGVVETWEREHGADAAGLRRADILHALQTVVTAWPITVERLHEFAVKAAREADLDTGWSDPDAGYEARLARLSSTLVAEAADPGSDLGHVVGSVRATGARIGLSVLALQLTCPGVPDLYQGAPAELDSLVDPDNRRPPDWNAWRALVDAATEGWPAGADGLADPDLARARLVYRVLQLRSRRPGSFGRSAGYVALPVTGDDAERVTAFVRTDADRRAVVAVVVVRPSSHDPTDLRADIAVPAGAWRNLVDGASVADGATPVSAIVGRVGVAVLAVER